MKKIKIGLFLDSYYPAVDGVVEVVHNLSKEFNKYCDVVLVVPDNESTKDDEKKEYPIIRVKSIKVPFSEYHYGIPDNRICKKLLSENFDIVHIHSPFVIGKLGIKVARKLNIPVIATLHTRFDFEIKKVTHNNFIVNTIIKNITKTFEKCDRVIAVNHSMIQVLKNYGYQGPSPIVVHNGTDLKIVHNKEEAKKIVNKKFHLSNQDILFLFVGRIIDIKNIFFILESLKLLKEQGYDFKMLYVGTGPDEQKLKNKISEYKLDDDVYMTGRIMDRILLKQIYYRADLFLFPSKFDASSLVQIEAASQMTPGLFIENSVTADTITNNVNGFTAPDDIQKYTSKIIEIINDKEKLLEVSKKAYTDLAKPWNEVAKETYEVYLNEIDEYQLSVKK